MNDLNCILNQDSFLNDSISFKQIEVTFTIQVIFKTDKLRAYVHINMEKIKPTSAEVLSRSLSVVGYSPTDQIIEIQFRGFQYRQCLFVDMFYRRLRIDLQIVVAVET